MPLEHDGQPHPLVKGEVDSRLGIFGILQSGDVYTAGFS